KRILLVAQRSPDIDDPQAGDLYPIGTVATVLQLLKLPDGTIKVLVEGVARAEIVRFAERDGLMTGHVRVLEPAYTRERREIDVQQIEKRIRGRVKSQMEKSQREYYLNEQMKAIQKELGEGEDAPNEVEDLGKKILNAGMPKPVEAKARAELNKLKQMSPMSAEA